VTVRDILKALSLEVIAGESELGREVTGGYASDLLSLVMAGAKAGNIWVTMQGHPNVVAVASLLGLAAVVVTEDLSIDPSSVERARENKVVLLATTHDSFTTVARLAALGIEGTR